MKVLIVLAFIGILGALASAGLLMLKHGRRSGSDADAAPPDRRMARALAVRVSISVTLFLLVLLAWQLGWIHPSGLPTGR